MYKLNKLTFIIVSLFCLLLLISSVSAVDLTVNSDTSHKNITDWMDNNSTIKGDNLIFNTSSYDLSDTLVLTKSINIKSDIKTQINFNQNKNMFNLTASEISFSGLTLDYNGKGGFGEPVSTIFAEGSKIITLQDTSINLNKEYNVAINMENGNCNIINSHINGNALVNYGVWSYNNLAINSQNSSITFNEDFGYGLYVLNKLTGDFTNTKIVLQSVSTGIFSPEWTGNFINSEITGKSVSVGMFIGKWSGKISDSTIILSGIGSVGLTLTKSKGTISKSTVHVKKGFAVYASGGLKVSKSSIKSKKGQPSVYYFGPRMHILKVSSYTKSKVYTFKIYNKGESKSKTSKLTITSGKFKKTVNVKGIKAGKTTTVKVTLPAKYASKKTKKSAKVVFYNSAGKKESSKILKFKF